MKRFELIVFDDGNGNQTQLTSNGYTALEIMALLELKKQEVIDCIKESAGPAKFEVNILKGE